MNRVCVVGLGYIGLPTASLLANRGFSVLGVDVSPEVVDTINRGSIHIVEPDLDVMVRSAVGSGNLRAAVEPEPADVFIVAVPTPLGADHQPDLSHVEAATRAILPHLRAGNLVVLESTSPVGTTDGVVTRLLGEGPLRPGEDIHIAYCPERVLPGRILVELIENSRVVGGINEASGRAAHDFYRQFVHGRVFVTNSRTAELVKLVENAFRDVNIAFANELAAICERDGVDVWELIGLANQHPRVNILQPGPGVGGHCIAVDPWFIVSGAPEEARLIRTSREINDERPQRVVAQILAHAKDFERPRIACLGLSYKANVDDVRESPALEIVRRLLQLNVGEILVCEPHLPAHSEFELMPLEEAVSGADIVAVLVDHAAFQPLRHMDLSGKRVVDTRGVLRPR